VVTSLIELRVTVGSQHFDRSGQDCVPRRFSRIQIFMEQRLDDHYGFVTALDDFAVTLLELMSFVAKPSPRCWIVFEDGLDALV